MRATQVGFDHLEKEVGRRNTVIVQLQATNTKLTLRVRELEEELEKWRAFEWTDIADNIGELEDKIDELEQDGKRLDWFERNWCAKIKNKFKEDILVIGGVEARGTDLRQVIDVAMAKAGGE